MIVISGYFLAPPELHKGYEDYFQLAIKIAKEKNEDLIVIINNKEQQILKYNGIIVPPKKIKKRLEKYFKIYPRTEVIISKNKDSRNVIPDLIDLKNKGEILFVKDGEYSFDNPVPEECIVNVIYGGNAKIASSSEILGVNKNA